MKRMKVSDVRHYDVMRWPHLDGWRARHCVRNEDGASKFENLAEGAMPHPADSGVEPVHATEADAMRACELHLDVYPEPVPSKWSEVDA